MSTPSPLPWFQRTEESPDIPGRDPGIVMAVTGRRHDDLVARGSWRIDAKGRQDLGPGPLRSRVWIVAVDRKTRMAWRGRPGAEAIVLEGEEPADGPAEGWFHCRLAEALGLPVGYDGTLDMVAVLGMERSEVASVEVRATAKGLP
jgi:hypothetical protein